MFWQNAYAGTISLPQASMSAVKVDSLHDFLFWVSLVLLAGTTFAVLYFTKKYHRSVKGRTTAYILGNHTLEIAWTVLPLILMLAIFAWGYVDYLWLRAEPQNPYEINVLGRQWMWNFEYSNGRKTLNELYLPKDRQVKLIMTSEDVLHDLFLPNMRIKQDVVPGLYTYLSFTPTLAGVHPIYCAEFCGTGHSDMLAKAIVLEQDEFDKWLATGKVSGITKVASGAPEPTKTLAEQGKEVYTGKGCFACHSTDGTRKVGPSWSHIWGTTEELEGGKSVVVDENYIRESIMEPQLKVVKGYPPSMPTFKGILSDQEVTALIAFIKSLK